MKRKITYTDAPLEIEEALDRSVTVRDYLPPPSELVLKVKPRQEARPVFRRGMAYA